MWRKAGPQMAAFVSKGQTKTETKLKKPRWKNRYSGFPYEWWKRRHLFCLQAGDA